MRDGRFVVRCCRTGVSPSAALDERLDVLTLGVLAMMLGGESSVSDAFLARGLEEHAQARAVDQLQKVGYCWRSTNEDDRGEPTVVLAFAEPVDEKAARVRAEELHGHPVGGVS